MQYIDAPNSIKIKYFHNMALPAINSPATPTVTYASLAENVRICA